MIYRGNKNAGYENATVVFVIFFTVQLAYMEIISKII